ncbi:MAG TPA: MBL fold metallo-hydrolase [Clostridia bacterium]|nr:MBL fold metallo-hydrolase [Clostridia bacterium]
MIIKWYGQSCFLITTGDGEKIVTDPFNGMLGYRVPSLEADLVTVSHQHSDHNNLAAVRGADRLVGDAGVIRIGKVDVNGIPSFHDRKSGRLRGENLIFNIEADGIHVCHLGDLGHELSPEQAAQIGPVDILLIPVGGFFTINGQTAAQVAAMLHPSIVVPMHYRTKAVRLRMPMISTEEPFLEAMGTEAETLSRLEILRQDLPQKLRCVVLDYNS